MLYYIIISFRFSQPTLLQYSAPAPAAAPDMDEMFGAPAAAAPAAHAVPSVEVLHHVDDSLIEEWERKKRAEMQERREASAKKKSSSMESGSKALTDFEVC